GVISALRSYLVCVSGALRDAIALCDRRLRLVTGGARDVVAEVAVVEAAARLPGIVGLDVATPARPLVGAALGHHVERHAGSRQRGVGAARRDLHLLEGVEV